MSIACRLRFRLCRKSYQNGGKNSRAKKLNEGGLTTMSGCQDNGTTILLGLEDYKVGEVWIRGNWV